MGEILLFIHCERRTVLGRRLAREATLALAGTVLLVLSTWGWAIGMGGT